MRCTIPVAPVIYYENITGELYEVDDQKLESLDKLERHPQFHRRQKISAIKSTTNQSESTQESLSCWFYLFTKYKEEMLDLKLEEDYDCVKNPMHEYKIHTEFKEYIKTISRQEVYDYISSQTVNDSKV